VPVARVNGSVRPVGRLVDPAADFGGLPRHRRQSPHDVVGFVLNRYLPERAPRERLLNGFDDLDQFVASVALVASKLHQLAGPAYQHALLGGIAHDRDPPAPAKLEKALVT
jgi:hypothetical protein